MQMMMHTNGLNVQGEAHVIASQASANASLATQALLVSARHAQTTAMAVGGVSHKNGLHMRRPKHMLEHGMQAWLKDACVTLVHVAQTAHWRNAHQGQMCLRARATIMGVTALVVGSVITALACAGASWATLAPGAKAKLCSHNCSM